MPAETIFAVKTGKVIEPFDEPIDQRCPLCGRAAIVELPLAFRAAQPDNTTHVCHPGHGGCNHGFVLEGGSNAS